MSAVQVTRTSRAQLGRCGTKLQSKGSSSESRGGGSRSGVGEYCCRISENVQGRIQTIDIDIDMSTSANIED